MSKRLDAGLSSFTVITFKIEFSAFERSSKFLIST